MTVAQMIRKLNKMPQDKIVTMSNNSMYVDGEYTVTTIETYDCSTVEICTNYKKRLTEDD